MRNFLTITLMLCISYVAMGQEPTPAGEQSVIVQKQLQKTPAVVTPAPTVVVPTPVIVQPAPIIVHPPQYILLPPAFVVPPRFVPPPKPDFPTPFRDSLWNSKVKKQEKQWYKQFDRIPILFIIPVEPQ